MGTRLAGRSFHVEQLNAEAQCPNAEACPRSPLNRFERPTDSWRIEARAGCQQAGACTVLPRTPTVVATTHATVLLRGSLRLLGYSDVPSFVPERSRGDRSGRFALDVNDSHGLPVGSELAKNLFSKTCIVQQIALFIRICGKVIQAKRTTLRGD